MLEACVRLWCRLQQIARLMVGIPDYDAYLAQRRRMGGHTPPLSRAAFVRHCAERRLSGRRPGAGGCC